MPSVSIDYFGRARITSSKNRLLSITRNNRIEVLLELGHGTMCPSRLRQFTFPFPRRMHKRCVRTTKDSSIVRTFLRYNLCNSRRRRHLWRRRSNTEDVRLRGRHVVSHCFEIVFDTGQIEHFDMPSGFFENCCHSQNTKRHEDPLVQQERRGRIN